MGNFALPKKLEPRYAAVRASRRQRKGSGNRLHHARRNLHGSTAQTGECRVLHFVPGGALAGRAVTVLIGVSLAHVPCLLSTGQSSKPKSTSFPYFAFDLLLLLISRKGTKSINQKLSNPLTYEQKAVFGLCLVKSMARRNITPLPSVHVLLMCVLSSTPSGYLKHGAQIYTPNISIGQLGADIHL